jgi:hypothetical protein
VNLLRVKPDGRTVIHVARTGEDLSAAPGRPFLGRRAGRYHARTFGESGLILLGSDPAAQKAVLERSWGEWSESIEPIEP